MYTDKRRGKRWPVFLAALLTAVLLVYGFWLVAGGSGREMEAEGVMAVRAAVQRSALQCYAVEGMYPPGLAYLEENYGLQINHEDYYVTYEAFASNLPPDVMVVRKSK